MAGRRKTFGAGQPVQVTATLDHVDEEVCSVIMSEGKELRFDRWLGRGIDEWVWACVRQLRAFAQGRSVTDQTLAVYAKTGLMYFFQFLTISRASYPPNQLTRARMEQFVSWLKTDSPLKKSSAQKTAYSNVKAVLIGLAKRGVIPNARQLIPGRQFPGSDQDVDNAEPLSQSERARFVAALRLDVIGLHRTPDSFSDAEALVVYGLALSLRTGLNTSPMMELRRDALKAHPFMPKMGLLTSYKGRAHATQWMTIGGKQPTIDTVAVPMDGVALFNKLLDRTRDIAESAPVALRNTLWLYRSAARNRRGQLKRMTVGVMHVCIKEFVRRHNLLGDDGERLRLNNRRLRATMENRLWKLSNGDLFTVADLMGHDPKVADRSYLAVTAEMRAHATIVGEALPGIYRGETQAEEPVRPARAVPIRSVENTPVGGCKDTLHGEKAPKDGSNHCADFLSCLGCRSYAVVGSRKDLHRLFSFYWFLAAERARIVSREWAEHFTWLMSLIDAYTLDKFDNALVEDAKAWAKSEPLKFWKNYQMHPGGWTGNGY